MLKDNNDIINYLSAKYNLDSDVIEKVIKSQFRFIKDTIEQGELQSVRLTHFGVFGIKPGRMKYLLDDGYQIKKKQL